jgi:hypothetical protein
MIPLSGLWRSASPSLTGEYPNALVPDLRIDPKIAERALATAGLFIAFGMFTAGLEKALHWINFDFSTSGFLSWFYPGYFTLDRKLLLAPAVLKVPPYLFKILDFLAVALLHLSFLHSSFCFQNALPGGHGSWSQPVFI